MQFRWTGDTLLQIISQNSDKPRPNGDPAGVHGSSNALGGRRYTINSHRAFPGPDILTGLMGTCPARHDTAQVVSLSETLPSLPLSTDAIVSVPAQLQASTSPPRHTHRHGDTHKHTHGHTQIHTATHRERTQAHTHTLPSSEKSSPDLENTSSPSALMSIAPGFVNFSCSKCFTMI